LTEFFPTTLQSIPPVPRIAWHHPEWPLAASPKHPPMPRQSNRSQQGRHSNRTSEALQAQHAQDPLHTQPPREHRNGHDDYGGLIGEEAASVYDGSHPRAGAPLGVGGVPLASASAPRVTMGEGEKPRTGEVVPSSTGKHSVALSGRDSGKAMRCTGRLSMVDATLIVASMRSPTLSAGRRVMMRRAGSTEQVIPQDGCDQARAVLRWTNRCIGRPVGMRWLKRSLTEYGLWTECERLAKRWDAKEKRKKTG
jgi:hypothetical protein